MPTNAGFGSQKCQSVLADCSGFEMLIPQLSLVICATGRACGLVLIRSLSKCFGKRRLHLVVRPWDGDAATESLRFGLLEEKNRGARLAHGETIVLDGSE